MDEMRAELYLTLAEALCEPPDWLARPGREWPLFTCAESLAPFSSAAAGAVPELAAIAPESPPARRSRYQALFAAPGRPRFWLYESLHRSGRLLGPEMHAVARLYEIAGLRTTGSELPDHASMELAFLAYLARQAALPEGGNGWRKLEKRFVRRHAGRWLPELGRGLANSGDPVYAPIGRLLSGLIEEVGRRPVKMHRAKSLPAVREEECTLCGFCVQVCPTRALAIDEDTRQTTLFLAANRCSGCGRCATNCATGALYLRGAPTAQTNGERKGWQPLRRSPRATCRACREPMVSRAELEFVASRLGRPHWLEYCLFCRAQLME